MIALCEHEKETAVRVGFFLAWQCLACGRIEITDKDLRNQ